MAREGFISISIDKETHKILTDLKEKMTPPRGVGNVSMSILLRELAAFWEENHGEGK